MRIAFLHICESRLARRRTGLRRIQGPRAFPTRFLIPSLPTNNSTILRRGPPSPLSPSVHARQKVGSEGPNASKSVQPTTTPKTKPHGCCGRYMCKPPQETPCRERAQGGFALSLQNIAIFKNGVPILHAQRSTLLHNMPWQKHAMAAGFQLQTSSLPGGKNICASSQQPQG